MGVPARLKWGKGMRGFAAYPVGTHSDGRYAEIWLYMSGMDTDHTPHTKVESWCWIVNWAGWFSVHGFSPSKQEAADKATEAWWTAILTEIPRDIDLEATMIAARVLVRPPPNSLFGEETAFLRKVQWNLTRIYEEEVKRDAAPAPVKELMSRLSEELYRRQLAEPEPEKPDLVISGGYRRRRRR